MIIRGKSESLFRGVLTSIWEYSMNFAIFLFVIVSPVKVYRRVLEKSRNALINRIEYEYTGFDTDPVINGCF